MTQDIGLFEIARLAGALLATTVAGPLGPFDLPDQALTAPPPPRAGLVAYVDGTSAGRLGRPGEGELSQAQAPDLLIAAILASEDASFFEHPGVDPVATLRAILAQLSGGRVQGASTIVQQTIKNAILTPERSLERKTIEAILAFRATQSMERRDILGVYLEAVYFGRGAHGFSAAAQAWFGKPWDKLDVGQIAFIAGVVQSPSGLDPVNNPDRALARRNYVLGRMAATGALSREEADIAIAMPLDVVDIPKSLPVDFNWSTSAARRDWPGAASEKSTGSATGDVTISTTLDARWQALVETSVPSYLRAQFASQAVGKVNLDDGLTPDDWNDARTMLPGPSLEWELGIVTAAKEVTLADGTSFPFPSKYEAGSVVAVNRDGDQAHDVTPPGVQAAVVVMDVANGAVLATIGGFDPTMTRFNRAWSNRQLGSAVKPFLWLAALESGMPFDQMVLDSPITITSPGGERWTPSNYDRQYSGAMPLYAALEQSSNLVAARLGQDVGMSNFALMAEAAGVYAPGQMRQNPSAVLGTSESSLLQLTAGYSAIVNGGMPVSPHVVTAIKGGRFDWTFQPPFRPRPIASEGSIAALQAMLRGVITRGTASTAFRNIKVPVIGKTGTSQDHKDAWFVGATDKIAVGIWLGRDDNTKIGVGATGGTLAAQIAAQIFTFANDEGLIEETGENWPPAPLDHRSIAGVGTWSVERGLTGSDRAPRQEDDAGPYTTPIPSAPGRDYFAIDNPNADLLGGSTPRDDGGLVFRSPW